MNDTFTTATTTADNGTLSKCDVTVGVNETTTCTAWEYFGDVGHTIVSQVRDAPG